MTWGFVASFGGLFAVMCVFAAFEYFISAAPGRSNSSPRSEEINAALERAQAATQEAAREIAHVRMTLGA